MITKFVNEQKNDGGNITVFCGYTTKLSFHSSLVMYPTRYPSPTLHFDHLYCFSTLRASIYDSQARLLIKYKINHLTKCMYIYFHHHINIELRKILHMHLYIIGNSEKIHCYQLCRHNLIFICWQYTSSKYSSFSLSILSPIADWYKQKWHWLEIRLHRSAWGSLFNTYHHSLSFNHHERYMEEFLMSCGLKKTTRARVNSARSAPSRLFEKNRLEVGQRRFCRNYSQGLLLKLLSKHHLSSKEDSVDLCTCCRYFSGFWNHNWEVF